MAQAKSPAGTEAPSPWKTAWDRFESWGGKKADQFNNDLDTVTADGGKNISRNHDPQTKRKLLLTAAAMATVAAAALITGSFPLGFLGVGAISLIATHRLVTDQATQIRQAQTQRISLREPGKGQERQNSRSPDRSQQNTTGTNWASIRASASHARPQVSQVTGQSPAPKQQGPIISGVKSPQRPALGA